MSISGLVKVVIIGFGNVGRGLVKTIALKNNELTKKLNITIKVVGVVDSKGMAVKKEGFNDIELLKLLEQPRSSLGLFPVYGRSYVDIEELYNEVQPDIHVELTPANYDTGEPGLSNIKRAFNYGLHVVTANKSPLVKAFNELTTLAKGINVKFKYSGTVMGATPFLRALKWMKAHRVEYLRGILNSTSNYILTLMHEKLLSIEDAVKEAQLIGLAESNPSLDIDGLDAAAKLVIISNVLGYSIRFEDVKRKSLKDIDLRDIIMAIKNGYVYKQVSTLNLMKKFALVDVEKIPVNDVLSGVKGAMNAVHIVTDTGEYFFQGKGGGGVETAHTVLNDIIEVALGD
jgi:Homoserine dehydrogenase